MSLTRGFLYAGAPNILFSLWKVFDVYTKDLMVSFYRHVLAGKSYSAALRRAKLTMLNKKQTSFPRMWSAFVLVGR